MLSIGTVGSGLRLLENRFVFDEGLRKLLELKRPRCLVVVGSADYPSFDTARERGVKVVRFPGETCARFSRKGERYV